MHNVDNFLKCLPNSPGIYQMLDVSNKILYVGKAKNLKKRVSSYFRKNLTSKTSSLMANVDDIKIMHTPSNAEALILECELIKKYKPKYNILLRDDKSFPFIVISKYVYPRLFFYRGARKKGEHYFGPFPSVNSARETMQLIQHVFLIRDCRDSYFSNRRRPCLQYQIGRCSAPCVERISKQDYQADIGNATAFLKGKNDALIAELGQQMQQAADKLDYEKAKKIRDQISSVRTTQSEQHIEVNEQHNSDVLAHVVEGGVVCMGLLMIRAGRVLGHHNFFPKVKSDSSVDEVWQAFLSQYYLSDAVNLPSVIVCEHSDPFMQDLLQAIFHKSQKKVKIIQRFNRKHRAWLDMAHKDAQFSLRKKLLQESKLADQFRVLAETLGSENINRMECFDISHHMGEAIIASNVVFNQGGALRSDYRRYNIENITAGDDYAAMQQALQRRFSNKQKAIPDVLVIDGGKGQIKIAADVLQTLKIEVPTLLSIAKGKARRADMDTILIYKNEKISIFNVDDSARHLLQFIRDEAHRFAITSHRKAKRKRQNTSILEGIPGVGAKKRQALLQYFGGLQGLKNQSINEIAKAPGISLKLAELVYTYLQDLK